MNDSPPTSSPRLPTGQVTEKEIHDQRAAIGHRLFTTTQHLSDALTPLQTQWQASPLTALKKFAPATLASIELGEADTLLDLALWHDIGDDAGAARECVYEITSTYCSVFFSTWAAATNAKLDLDDALRQRASEKLFHWTWFNKGWDQDEIAAAQAQRVPSIAHEGYAKSALGYTGYKLDRHRQAILQLPILLAQADPAPIQAFIDTALNDIDYELWQAIHNDADYYATRHVIADDETALSYLSHAAFMLDCAPPNLYAYLSGNRAVHFFLEVVLLTHVALLAPTFVSARITMLIKKLQAALAAQRKKLARGERDQFAAAGDAFIQCLSVFSQAAIECRQLGHKLAIVREPAVTENGECRHERLVMRRRTTVR